MSALTFSRLVLVCDGCQKRHGEPHGHNSAQEARIAAYIDGWRFPATVKKDGSQGTGASDVCPDCIPTWVPQRWLQRPGRGAHLPISEAPRGDVA
ncbi:hypothetical protein [Streptomyces sp. NPDC086519]|uniref:hypothetical protein n=1 Tax=Streptomyces sp. NPDC086519 TaxID=3154863 RepID=UPI00343B8276